MSTMPSLGNALTPPEPIGSLDELHNALQWLARMARSFGPPPSPDGVTLIFEPGRRRFLTPEIAGRTALELALPGLVFQFEEDGRASPHAMDVEEKSSTEIEAWLLCEMLHRGFDRDRFSKALPYRQERPLTGDERKYAPSEHMDELGQLGDSLVAASAVLLRARDAEAAKPRVGDSRLVCWPERLEIGFVAPSVDGASALQVGFRLAGLRPGFFVRPDSNAIRLIAPLEMPSAAEASADEVAVRLLAMMASARTSLAH